jgi:hypothetical protein
LKEVVEGFISEEFKRKKLDPVKLRRDVENEVMEIIMQEID